MKSALKQLSGAIADRLPYLSSIRSRLKAVGEYGAGHYYSPIPDEDEVRARLNKAPNPRPLPEIDLQREQQFELLKAFQAYYQDMPFKLEENSAYRYDLSSSCFGHGNGFIHHAMLRHVKPKRIIEIGTGSSSVLTLDTLAWAGNKETHVTFIEPHAENVQRLESRLTADEKARHTLLAQAVQDVDLDVFRKLEAGDLLFVASSHVLKFGNDLQQVLFEVMPLLPPGITVYFHNVFFPLEYPEGWLRQGRYWNESYFLRAFLAYNSAWKIRFFNHYAGLEFKDHLEKKMPLCATNPGSGIYLERVL